MKFNYTNLQIVVILLFIILILNNKMNKYKDENNKLLEINKYKDEINENNKIIFIT